MMGLAAFAPVWACLGVLGVSPPVGPETEGPDQQLQKASELASRGEWPLACDAARDAARLAPRREDIAAYAAGACGAAGRGAESVAAFTTAWRLAVEERAFDRVASYQHNALLVLYVQPDWANQTRQAASPPPVGAAAEAAFAEFSALYGQAQQAIARGQGEVARPIAQSAVALVEKHLGAAHPSTLAAHNQLGDALRLLEDYEGARLQYELAIRGAQQVLGEAHPDALVYLNNLGACSEGEGDLAGAQWAYERAYQGARKSLGEESPVTLTYVNNLGNVIGALGQRDRADRILRSVLTTKERLLGTDHFDPLAVRLNIALNDVARGQKKGAEALLEQGLFTAYATLGEDHPVTQGLVKTLMRVRGIDLEDGEGLGTLIADMLESRNQAADQARARGQWQQAETLLRRVLAVEMELLGAEHAGTLVTMSALGDLLLVGGRYQEAEPLFRAALDVGRTVFGEKHANTVTATGNLALLYEKLGRYAQAQELAQRAVDLSREVLGADHDDTLAHENDLALVANARGQFPLARQLYESVLARRLESLGPDHPQTLRSQHNLAMFLLAQGEYERALDLAWGATTRRKKVLGKTHPDYLLSLSAFGLAQFSRGYWSRAQQTWEEALALRARYLGPNHPDTLNTQSDLAALHITMNRPDRAEPLLEDTLKRRREVLGETHPFTLVSVNDLATVYRMRGRIAEARSLFLSALASAETTLGVEHVGILPPLNNLAFLYESLGQYDEAITLYRRAVHLSEHSWGPTHPNTLTFVSNLATTLTSRGEFDEAERLHLRVLAAQRAALDPGHPDRLRSLNGAAWHMTVAGKESEAQLLWEESIDGTDRFLSHVLYGIDQRTRLALLDDMVDVRNPLLTFVSVQNNPRAATLALAFSSSRKGLTQRISAEINAVARSLDNPEMQRSSRALFDARSRLAERTLAGPGGETRDAFVAEQLRLNREIERIETQLGRVIAPLMPQNDPSVDQIVAALQRDEVLIDFLAYESLARNETAPHGRQLLAVVVDPSRQPDRVVVPLGSMQAIDDAIGVLRGVLNAPQGGWGRPAEDASRRLYELLVTPLLEHLQDKQAVYLVPDGRLHLLPFVALRTADGVWALERHPFVILTSSRDLLVQRAPRAATKPVIFSAPDYGPSPEIAPRRSPSRAGRGLRFVPLPGTALEGEALRARLAAGGAVRHVSGAAATEAALVASVEHPRLLHLATHGFFLGAEHGPAAATTRGMVMAPRPSGRPDVALRMKPTTRLRTDALTQSGLAFAGANRSLGGETLADGTDGILTAVEALALDLVGTELVVLSACETGVGDVDNAEGVYGLRRAFHQAGARTVLSTLWSIDDAATLAFMDGFYGRWIGGAPPHEALAATQKEMAKSGRFAHPFYWAPFVVSGRP